jgi:anaerobic selenocysteine-containing dehydrogenase
MVYSHWHNRIALNEKAVPPYYESKSEWRIMNDLSLRLKAIDPNLCNLPVFCSEEEYLNQQFNHHTEELFGCSSIVELQEKEVIMDPQTIAWHDKQFATATGKYQFYSPEAKQNGFPPTPQYIAGKKAPMNYPFWLITPHHPYAINSQFHYLNLSDERESYVGIHPNVAKRLHIFDGEIVKVYNDQDTIKIKAVYSKQVAEDILLIYQGWDPVSNIHVNRLIPVLETDMGEKVSGAKGIAYYDAFVNVAKL